MTDGAIRSARSVGHPNVTTDRPTDLAVTNPGWPSGDRSDVTPLSVSDRELIAAGLLAKVAERLAALGQVVRLRLIEQLASGPATPQELADTLGLTQPNVSKHLVGDGRAVVAGGEVVLW